MHAIHEHLPATGAFTADQLPRYPQAFGRVGDGAVPSRWYRCHSRSLLPLSEPAQFIVTLFSVLPAGRLQDSANDGLVNLGEHGLNRRIWHAQLLEQDDIVCARNVWEVSALIVLAHQEQQFLASIGCRDPGRRSIAMEEIEMRVHVPLREHAEPMRDTGLDHHAHANGKTV